MLSLLLLALVLGLFTVSHTSRIHYTRDRLLELKASSLPLDLLVDFNPVNSEHIFNCNNDFMRGSSSRDRSKRKRGKKGGARQRLRKLTKTNRLPLPSIVLSNVQSLKNKTDELQACVSFMHEFRDVCVLAFTETWLTAIINPGWCNNITVRERICPLDIELLSVSVRPFYLPREFPQLFLSVVYIHPSADAKTAAEVVYSVSQRLQSLSPEAPCLFLGDFNHVNCKKALNDFKQYVTCPTRGDKTLDLCYGSIKGAYRSVAAPKC